MLKVSEISINSPIEMNPYGPILIPLFTNISTFGTLILLDLFKISLAARCKEVCAPYLHSLFVWCEKWLILLDPPFYATSFSLQAGQIQSHFNPFLTSEICFKSPFFNP